ncbi:phosphopantetheine-binding protein [Ruminiclostridium papyrosolvens DSM 2782]|uniref:Phosphopantetheine-binding protein n=1 Tax=Ruminiclostridium papyrosolvens DSM 2782 TaxID=588581 RepID=F1TDH3_9FIRM|nr:acyl carrier protein [Ruminiclostridium papyrosolvens]EGD47611.1 phosphopantetheine-binding protein [Ruminiclostridium papyrosolvens DSM 2782]WES36444.1 acyl carrier protein [Ruminiclostridium papyrosolvens DSM 2782]
MEYREKIRSFIEGNLIIDDEQAQFSDNDNFFALGFVNSLFAMKLVNLIENEFSIQVDNEDLDISNFNSVDNIVSFIANKKG